MAHRRVDLIQRHHQRQLPIDLRYRRVVKIALFSAAGKARDPAFRGHHLRSCLGNARRILCDLEPACRRVGIVRRVDIGTIRSRHHYGTGLADRDPRHRFLDDVERHITGNAADISAAVIDRSRAARHDRPARLIVIRIGDRRFAGTHARRICIVLLRKVIIIRVGVFPVLDKVIAVLVPVRTVIFLIRIIDIRLEPDTASADQFVVRNRILKNLGIGLDIGRLVGSTYIPRQCPRRDPDTFKLGIRIVDIGIEHRLHLGLCLLMDDAAAIQHHDRRHDHQ